MKKNGLSAISRMTSRGPTLALVLIAITALGIFPRPALAGKVDFPNMSNAQLKSLCDKYGGAYAEDQGGGGSACLGSGGSIQCTNNGKCTGQCETCGGPDVKHKPTTIFGVLSGTILKAGTTAPRAKGTAGPIHVKQPVVDSNSGTTNNNEHQGKKK
jgi:hypothetical protein